MAIPTKNSALVAWGSNFKTKFTAAPVTYGGTAAQATAFTAVYDPYVAANTAASAETQTNKSLRAIRNACKASLLAYARMLYTQIQANTAVSDPAKVELGIQIKSPPSPVEAPTLVPAITVIPEVGRNVRVEIRNPITGKRKKPAGSTAVALYSFVGPTPPGAGQQWHPEGSFSMSSIIAPFPTVAPSTVVWFTAYYVTARGLSGVSATPVSTRIGWEGADPLAS